MNCNVALVWIHDYMDGELPREDILTLKSHLQSCPACRSRFEQLERTEALLFTAMKEEPGAADQAASETLNRRILDSLPKRKKQRTWTRWVRQHPAAAAAAVFVLVMLASFTTSWNNSSELSVRGSDLQHVVINGDTVTVPEGASVNGDLTIENGTADVRGDVNGNVTVIDGSLYTASTAHIAGQTKQIDRALDWFWYKVTETFSGLTN